LLIESSLVNVGVVIPAESSLGSCAFVELAFVDVAFALFGSLPFKAIVLEASTVASSLGVKLTVLSFCAVVPELTVVVRAVSEDISPPSFGFAVVEVANVKRPIRFVHLPEPIGSGVSLAEIQLTSSNCPT